MSSRLSACTWRPATSKHKVRGVETISPTGPQSQLQNTAAMTTDKGDNPVVWPYSLGSSNWLAMSSTARYRPSVEIASDQPGSTAAASTAEKSAAMQMP